MCMQAARQKLLEATAEKGCVKFTSGRRKGFQGRAFDILDGVQFNIEGPDGEQKDTL